MRNNILVSVIIPVYNVEKFLEECLNSILRQTYKNLEIILVDDGSTDSSGTICDNYKLLDDRIKVIHKKNGGLSDARNAGIDVAIGDFISFIDSDDYVSEIFIEVLLSGVNNKDCKVAALSQLTDFWDGENSLKLDSTTKKVIFKKVTSKNALKLMLYQQIPTGAPFKIYHRSVFENIRFPYGYYYEDVATTYKTFENTQNVMLVKATIYAYRKRRNSIIRQPFSEKKLSAIKIFEELKSDKIINELDLKSAAYSRAFAMMFSVFLQVPPKNINTQKIIWKKIRECRNVVAFDNDILVRKKNKYAAWISFMGMKISYLIGRKFGQKGSMN